MIDFLVGVLVTVAVVVVVRRLVGIRSGRWATTLLAVLIADAAAIQILRLVYGSLRDVPGRAVFGTWALLTIFAVLAVLLVELLSRQRQRRHRRVPHPIRGARAMGRRVLRYAAVGRIWIHRGLLHTGDDAEVVGSRLGRSLRLSFEDAGGLFVKLGQAMAQQPQLVTPAVAAELASLQEGGGAGGSRCGAQRHRGGPRTAGRGLRRVRLRAPRIGLDRADVPRAPARRPGVVVKVQRPGVAEAIEGDLDILRRLADRFDRRTTWARSIGLKELVVGFDERTREELDFRIEATNQSLAARAA